MKDNGRQLKSMEYAAFDPGSGYTTPPKAQSADHFSMFGTFFVLFCKKSTNYLEI